jgi:hypothetical protein
MKQGWLQAGLVVLAMVCTVLLTYAKLDARADTALATAVRAETKAAMVEATAIEMKNELIQIKTILDERLPKK